MTDEERLNEKKKRLEKLYLKKEWILHPGTKDWREKKEERIRLINDQLTEVEELSQDRRLLLIAERRAHRLDLDEMNYEPDSEIEILKRQIVE